MYNYWGFGLNIATEIEFPELMPGLPGSIADVTITIGKTPRQLSGDNIVHKVGVAIGPNEYLLKLLNIANYYAANGNTIIIEPLYAADARSVRLFLLSSVMAAILHQRDRVILHASTIKYQDGAVLFCGPANSGKSTLAAKLQQQGYPLFSDEVCVLQFAANGRPEVLPSYPMLKLWEDSFEKSGLVKPGTAYKIRPKLPKYALLYHEDFDTTPQLVKQIYILNNDQRQVNTEIKKLNPVDAFSQLHNNIYHRLQIYPMQKQAINFTAISKLAAADQVFSATWHDHDEHTGELSSFIISHLQANG